MPTILKTKNSVTTTVVPTTLQQGELAVNITDKKLWVGNAATTPVQLLGDGGSASFSSIAFGAGTVSTPSITFTGDTNTGMYSPAADTIAFTEGGVESMRIDSSGNVGIGTSSPTQQLNFTGNALTSGWYRGGAGTAANPTFTVDGNTGMYRASSGDIAFSTSNAERMRIDSSGNVLVGTTTLGGVGFSVGVDGAGRILTSNVSAVPFDVYFFKNSGTTVGKITINTSSTSYTTTSDYRLKENIIPMTGALATVSALKPVTYKWKLDGSASQGFIAHELQAVVPECVTGEKDATEIQQYEISSAVPATYDDEGNELTPAVEAVMGEREVPAYQGIDTSFLVATLTAAIQEQQAMIEELKAKVAALEVA